MIKVKGILKNSIFTQYGVFILSR